MLMIGECREWYTDIIVLVFKCSVRLTFFKIQSQGENIFLLLGSYNS